MIRRIQIKTTMNYHLTLARTIMIKKSKDSKLCRGCGGKKALCTPSVAMQIGIDSLENNMKFLPMIKCRTTI